MTLLVLAAALVTWPGASVLNRVVSPDLRSRVDLPWRRLSLGLVPAAAWWAGGLCGAIAAGTVTATICFLRRRQHELRASARFRHDLTDGLAILVAELSIGASSVDSCSVVAQECAGEVGRIFATASSRSALGGSCGESLLAESGRLGGDIRRIGAAWRLAEQRGLPILAVLQSARRDLTARTRFDTNVHASLAGARATATVLSALPLFGIALGECLGAHPIGLLLAGGSGGALLIVGSGLACAGLLWTAAITAGARA